MCSTALLAGLVLFGYLVGFRVERAVLRITPVDDTSGSVRVNRLAHTDVPACLSPVGSYNVHPRDFDVSIVVLEGEVTVEYAVYRGSRVFRRASGIAKPGQSLILRGTAFSTRAGTGPASNGCFVHRAAG